MADARQRDRVDTVELKLEILKKLGKEKAMKYFRGFERFLAMRMGKTEFEKMCDGIFGRKNVVLHNRLIKAILGNAQLAHGKARKGLGGNGVKRQSSQESTLSSERKDNWFKVPRKLRSKRGGRSDRWSPLGPHRKTPPSVNGPGGAKSPDKSDGESVGSKSPLVSGVLLEKGTGSKVMPVAGNMTSVNVKERNKCRKRRTGFEEMPVGSNVASKNVGELSLFQEKQEMPVAINVASEKVQELSKVQEKQELPDGSIVASENVQELSKVQEKQQMPVGSNVSSGNVQGLSKFQTKQTCSEEMHVNSKVATGDVQELCKFQEKQAGFEEMHVGSRAFLGSVEELCKFQENQIPVGSKVVSCGVQRLFKSHEKQNGPELKSRDKKAPTFEEVCKRMGKQSGYEVLSLGSKWEPEIVSVGLEVEVEQQNDNTLFQSRSPVRPPLGISMGLGALPDGDKNYRITSDLGSSMLTETCESSLELPDTTSLMNRMNQKLEHKGLSVTADCANLLNHALDAYLTRLLKASLDLTRSRQSLGNGTYHITGSACQQGREQSMNQGYSASVEDFQVSMQMEPQLLGVDWPAQLEKISLRLMDE